MQREIIIIITYTNTWWTNCRAPLQCAAALCGKYLGHRKYVDNMCARDTCMLSTIICEVLIGVVHY